MLRDKPVRHNIVDWKGIRLRCTALVWLHKQTACIVAHYLLYLNLRRYLLGVG